MNLFELNFGFAVAYPSLVNKIIFNSKLFKIISIIFRLKSKR